MGKAIDIYKLIISNNNEKKMQPIRMAMDLP